MNSATLQNVELDLETLKAFHAVSYREAGLILAPEKIRMVQSRLRTRLRASGLPDFQSYLALITSDQGAQERRQMISALTTNVSHFFREAHHFDVLADRVLPTVQARLRDGGRFRIWSAGCSNGQEAFSILMHLLDKDPSLASKDFRVLGTDIDQKVVAFANRATYPARMIEGVPDRLRDRFMSPVNLHGQQAYTMNDALRQLVAFKELNLLASWPMRHRFDAIFCRNVVIYFDMPTQDALWPRFRNALTPEGLLFLGHSERVSKPEAMGLKVSGPTIYTVTHSASPAPAASQMTKGTVNGPA